MNQCHCYLILIFSYESFILLLMEAWVGLLDVTESVAHVGHGNGFLRFGS